MENSVWQLITELSQKKGVSEIVINGPKNVFIEMKGRFTGLNVNLSKNDIYTFVTEVADYNKKSCDHQNPLMDGNLPDGSRINVVMDPLAHGSPAITIRRYNQQIVTFDSSENLFGLGKEWIQLLRCMVQSRSNIIVSGGTGVGKTTFLNLMLQEIPQHERLVTIEDTLELSFSLPNVVRLEVGHKDKVEQSEITTRDMVKNTLRMRPDRIIIGEVRGSEVFDLLQAMNTGHEGSMTSIHANSPTEALTRLEGLYLFAGFDIPYHVVRKQMVQAIDFIIQLERTREGKRVVKEIIELTGMEGDQILSQKIGQFDDGKFGHSGYVPSKLERLKASGLPEDFFNSL